MTDHGKTEMTSLPAVALPVWIVAAPPNSVELLKTELRGRGAQQMGVNVRIAVLKMTELLAMNEKTWAMGKTTLAASENDASALLLTYYLHELDHGGRDSRLLTFKEALAQGLPQDLAIKKFILAGRDVEAFEREVGLAYQALGIGLHFTRRGGAIFKP